MEFLKLVIILIMSKCFDDHAHDRDNDDHGDDYDQLMIIDSIIITISVI